MTHEEFAAYHKVWREPIREMAWRLARGDRDLADDLEQEGLIALAEFELAMVEGNEEGCVKTVVYCRMCSVRRTEMRGGRIPAWTPKRRGRVNGQDRREDGRDVDAGGATTRQDGTEGQGDGAAGCMTRWRPPARVQRMRVPRHWDAAPLPDEA